MEPQRGSNCPPPPLKMHVRVSNPNLPINRSIQCPIKKIDQIVIPVIENNTVVWSHSKIQDIDSIERVQRNFTKSIGP